MSTISYAQAAKGAAVQTISQSAPGSPPSNNSQAKDEATATTTSVTAASIASSDVEGLDLGKNGQADAEVTLPRQDLELADDSAPSITSGADQSIKSSRESDTTVESHQQQDEKTPRSTNRHARSHDGHDARKGRKGKKGRNNDKEAQSEQQQQDEKKEEKEKVVLSEAPLPAVNIWKQRQEHRAKQAPTVTPAPSTVSPNGAESKKPHAAQEEGDAQAPNGTAKEKTSKKGSDQSRNGDHGQRRSAPRGARGNDKDDKSSGNLPSVEDTSAWPDPKSAASSEVAGQKPQVKTPTTDREGREEPSKPQQRSWQKMDVQHTVIFNTPFSTRGGHRPRGGARGGRESGSTREPQANNNNAGAQNAASDKTAAVNGTNATKGTTFHARDSVSTRGANAAPAVPKRASVDGPAPKDQRKSSVSAQVESAREPGSENAAPSKKGLSHRAAYTDIRLTNGELGPAVPKTAGQDRPKSSEPVKDGQTTTNNQHHGAREGRPERGRGGGYRNRAGHNGAAGQHGQQNSYTQNGQYNAPSFQPRQNATGPTTSHSGQFPGYGQQTRGRGGQHRWNGSSRNNSNGASYAPRPAAPVGDLPVQQYIPYSYQPMPSLYEGLIPMVKAQLEYYFSVDNLCKDMWLRRNMDCLGFVKLEVVAGFNRLNKLITGSGGMELLRATCLSSDLIDFAHGEDGADRLRNREKWREFVLQAKDRIEGLQHDTPTKFTIYPKPNFYVYSAAPVAQHYAVTSPVDIYAPYPQDHGYPAAYVNGVQYEQNGNGANGHHYFPEATLSAGVPDFAPAASAFTLDSMNNITDSGVERVIILEKRGSDSTGAGAVGYISDNYHAQANGIPVQSESTSNSDASNGVTKSSKTTTWFNGEPSESPVERPYIEVKQAALAQRKQAKGGETSKEMSKLYEFWSQMLLSEFNAKVYEEFRSLSLEDAAQDNLSGLRCLLAFFQTLFDTSVHKPWLQIPTVPDIFSTHYREAFEIDQKKVALPAEKSA